MVVFGQNGKLEGQNAVPNEFLVKWIGERLDIEDFGNCTTIGFVHKGHIAGVALYNNFRHPNIEISFAIESPHWASKGAVRAIFHYPLVQLGCRRLTATISSKNLKVKRLLEHFGFKLEGVIREALDDGDAIIYGILRSEAERWLCIMDKA